MFRKKYIKFLHIVGIPCCVISFSFAQSELLKYISICLLYSAIYWILRKIFGEETVTPKLKLLLIVVLAQLSWFGTLFMMVEPISSTYLFIISFMVTFLLIDAYDIKCKG